MKKLIRNLLILVLSLNIVLGIKYPVLASFEDTKGHWARKEIDKAVELGWAKGYEDSIFGPDKNVTRGEFISILSRSIKYDFQSIPESLMYSDIVSESPYYEDCLKLSSLGLIQGVFKDDRLNVNQAITRIEVGQLIDSSLILDEIIRDYENDSTISTYSIYNKLSEKIALRNSLSFSQDMLNYSDRSSIPQESVPALINLYNSKIFMGYSDKTFRPNNEITRGESIATLLRAKKIDLKDDKVEVPEEIRSANSNIKENLANQKLAISPDKRPKNNSESIDQLFKNVPSISGELKREGNDLYLYSDNQIVTIDQTLEGLVKLNDIYYLIGNDNLLISDFFKLDGNTYYVDGEKGLIRGWKQIGDYLHYFSPLNYRMYSDGVFSTGRGVFWFDDDGRIKTGARPGGYYGRKIHWAYPTNEDLNNDWILKSDSDLPFLSQEMANWAASKEGLPFKWYGVDLNDPSGVYCCGAVYSMLKENGYDSADPNTMNIRADGGYLMVKEQYRTAEKFGGSFIPLDYKNMWPGDISFYYTPKSNYGYNHSAIFLGYNGGRPIIAHATLADGFVIEDSSIVTNKWGYKAKGAVRFVH